MIRKRYLCFSVLVLSCAFSSVWCASSSGSDDDDDSSSSGVVLATLNAHGHEEAGGDFHAIDMGAIGLVTIDHMLPFLKPVEQISDGRRRQHIELVLADYHYRKPEKMNRVRTAIDLHRARSEQIRGGLEVTIEKDDVRPPIEWLVNKIIQKDSEYLGRKVTREQKRKWITGVTSAIVAGGLTYGAAVLIAYLESLASS